MADAGIDLSTPLADIVTAHPALARVLDRYDLDYCCHGGRSLATACTEADLDAEAVRDELTAAAGPVGQPPEWAGLGPAALVDHLETVHHRPLDAELPRLSELLARIEAVHGPRHPELAAVRRTFEEIRADLAPHLREEEMVLFPMIREIATSDGPVTFHCGSLRNPISVMLTEHDRVGALLDELRATTDGFRVPDDGCASYTAAYAGLQWLDADTRLHVHKENNLLFPAVVALEDSLCAP